VIGRNSTRGLHYSCLGGGKGVGVGASLLWCEHASTWARSPTSVIGRNSTRGLHYSCLGGGKGVGVGACLIFHAVSFIIIKWTKPEIPGQRVCNGTRGGRERILDFRDRAALHSWSRDLHGQGGWHNQIWQVFRRSTTTCRGIHRWNAGLPKKESSKQLHKTSEESLKPASSSHSQQPQPLFAWATFPTAKKSQQKDQNRQHKWLLKECRTHIQRNFFSATPILQFDFIHLQLLPPTRDSVVQFVNALVQLNTLRLKDFVARYELLLLLTTIAQQSIRFRGRPLTNIFE